MWKRCRLVLPGEYGPESIMKQFVLMRMFSLSIESATVRSAGGFGLADGVCCAACAADHRGRDRSDGYGDDTPGHHCCWKCDTWIRQRDWHWFRHGYGNGLSLEYRFSGIWIRRSAQYHGTPVSLQLGFFFLHLASALPVDPSSGRAFDLS